MVARRQSQKYECNVGVRKHTLRWQEWFPGLDNDHETLGDVLATLPASPPTAIPWIVRLLENPNGWLHLHGAVDLGVHDSIHVLLGRGLLAQDEAFVIGFTMGSTHAVRRAEQFFFKVTVAYLYPDPYRIPWPLLVAYDLGLEAGQRVGIKNFHQLITEDMRTWKLGKVRRALGIRASQLRVFYSREQALLPLTRASQRLFCSGRTTQIVPFLEGGN